MIIQDRHSEMPLVEDEEVNITAVSNLFCDEVRAGESVAYGHVNLHPSTAEGPVYGVMVDGGVFEVVNLASMRDSQELVAYVHEINAEAEELLAEQSSDSSSSESRPVEEPDKQTEETEETVERI